MMGQEQTAADVRKNNLCRTDGNGGVCCLSEKKGNRPLKVL